MSAEAPRAPSPSTWVALGELLTLPNLGLNLFFVLAFTLLLSDGRVAWPLAALVLLAFVGARNAGHAFNQLVDRKIDAENPRTRDRPLPRGAISPRGAALVVVLNVLLFFGAAAAIRPLLVLLAVPALGLVLGYSYTKRYTAATTVLLGAVQGLIPAGVDLALHATVSVEAGVAVIAMVLFGTAFESVHSLGDLEADRAQGLRSLPLAVGATGTPYLVAGLLAGGLALLLQASWSLLGPSLPFLIGWLGMGVVAGWEVHGLAHRSSPLLRLFRSHFVQGGVYLLSVIAGLVLPHLF